MNNIKLEEEIRLETILMSVNKSNITKLNELLNVKEIDTQEKQLLGKFIYMTNLTETSLSVETLKKEFPSLYFDNSVKLNNDDELDDYIMLYIADKKNNSVARQLMTLANIVRTNGVTEEVSTKLVDITKSDVVAIPYMDITKNIVDIYDKKANVKGISTGIVRMDEDTGGLQPGTLSTILRIYRFI